MAKSRPELYKPAEACKMAEVAPYVLRYWETEFPVLSERKDASGKLYSGREVKIISRIRELLYDEGFTVAGARKRLESEISEGRFDDGLVPAPSPAEQKKAAAKAAVSRPGAVGSSAASLFPAESGSTAKAAAPTEFPERKRVLKELKEIARLLDRGSAR